MINYHFGWQIPALSERRRNVVMLTAGKLFAERPAIVIRLDKHRSIL